MKAIKLSVLVLFVGVAAATTSCKKKTTTTDNAASIRTNLMAGTWKLTSETVTIPGFPGGATDPKETAKFNTSTTGVSTSTDASNAFTENFTWSNTADSVFVTNTSTAQNSVLAGHYKVNSNSSTHQEWTATMSLLGITATQKLVLDKQ